MKTPYVKWKFKHAEHKHNSTETPEYAHIFHVLHKQTFLKLVSCQQTSIRSPTQLFIYKYNTHM